MTITAAKAVSSGTPRSTGAPHLACTDIPNFAQLLCRKRDASDIDQQASQRPTKRYQSQSAGGVQRRLRDRTGALGDARAAQRGGQHHLAFDPVSRRRDDHGLRQLAPLRGMTDGELHRRRRPSPARRPPTVGAPGAGRAPPARTPAPGPRESTTSPRRPSGRRPARRPPARSGHRRGPRDPCRPAPGHARPSPAPACANRAGAGTIPACCGPARPTVRPDHCAAAPPGRDRRCRTAPARRTRRLAATTRVVWSPSAAASCRAGFRRRRRPTVRSIIGSVTSFDHNDVVNSLWCPCYRTVNHHSALY